MGFLSGVLSAVKDDDAVKTYKDFNDIIRELEKYIGKGYGVEGLQQALGVVKEGLLWYEDRLSLLTGRVTDGLNKLSGKLSSDSSSGAGNVYYQAVKEGHPLPTQLTAWKRTVQKITQDIEEIENKHLVKLDSTLHDQIMHKIEPVKKVVEHLSSVASNTEFGDKVEKVHSEISEKEKHVTDLIGKKAEELQKDVGRHFDSISANIKAIEGKRTGELASIKASVGKLVASVEQGNKYADALNTQYDEIVVKELKQIDTKIKECTTDEITKNLHTVYTQITLHLMKLQRQLHSLRNLHIEVHEKVGSDMAQVKIDLGQQISALKKEIEDKMKAYIKSYVTKVKMSVGGIKHKVGNDNNDKEESVAKNWILLRDEITRLAADIKNGDSRSGEDRRYKGLKGIQQKVADYHNDFKTFGNVIARWVDNILKKDKVIISKVNAYVTGNANKFKRSYTGSDTSKIDQHLTKEIADIFKSQLLGKIGDIKVEEGNGTTKEYLENVVKGCTKFATTLNGKLVGDDGKATFDVSAQLADEINNAVKNGSGSAAEKTLLTYPVHLILEQLVVVSRQTADALESITAEKDHVGKEQYNLGTNVDETLGKVNLIGDQFAGAKTKPDQHGRKIDESLADVQQQINTLDASLHTATTSVDRISGTDSVEVGDSIEKRVEENINNEAVDNKLHSLLQYAIKNGIQKLNVKVNEVIHQQLDASETAIEMQNNKLNRNAIDQAGNIQAQITKLHGNLAALKPLVREVYFNADRNVKRRVTLMKDQVVLIFAEVTTISREMQAFSDMLGEVIKEAEKNIEEKREELLAHMKRDKEEVIGFVVEAFLAVKNAVQSMFAAGHKADLKALKELVDAQKYAIQAIVDEDKKCGLKGLLLEMYKDKGNEIKKLQLNSVIESERFEKLSERFNAYLTLIFTYITQQIKTTSTSPSSASTNEETKLLSNVQGAIGILLENLKASKHFDKVFVSNLQSLLNAVDKFIPSHFAGAPNPKLLDVIKKGLIDLYAQLDRAYVSRYSGDKLQRALLEKKENGDVEKPAQAAGDADDDKKLTKYGRKCAYVLVTCISGWYDHFSSLKMDCRSRCSSKQISLTETAEGSDQPTTNPLGELLKSFGYNVSKFDGQEGELRNSNKCRGSSIAKLLTYTKITTRTINIMECVNTLFANLSTYYTVCHMTLPSSQKYPCTVRDQLVWLCGLSYTAVYNKIGDHCNKMLNEKLNGTDRMPNNEDKVISKILKAELYYNLRETCRLAHDVLVTICGNGCGFDQADYPYACNFMDNSRGFHYPDSVGSLFDILADICRRLLCSLYFLRARCRYTLADGNGWADCSYGQQVPSASWQCSNHKSGEATSEARCQTNSKATCQPNSKANCQPNCQVSCQPTSPLQCHLMDQLPGCLPHRLTSVGCKSECNTCPTTSPGQQCVTPMGFWDLTHAASKRGTGKDLFDALDSLCKDGSSPLTALLRNIYCLYPYPPKSLGDMFTFFCQLFRTWRSADSLNKQKPGYIDNDSFLSNMRDNTIYAAFPLPTWLHKNFTNADLTNAITNLYHSVEEHNHPLPKKPAGKGTENTVASNTDASNTGSKPTSSHSDLASLTTLSALCKNSPACSPYLQPLYFHAYNTYPQKHSALYLSWITYTAWNFWNLLHELLSEFQKISCKSYGCASCNCLTGKHGERGACKCASLVQCSSVVSTFHKYGFTFGKAKNLMNAKTCDVFCEQLQRVLKSTHFKYLFDMIDKFVFHIRLPFIWLNVALWLLSLLYLLHIMVIRLDLLHIKSHLHSPSSHRIAAQSLLAAGRVTKLNRVFYLQP